MKGIYYDLPESEYRRYPALSQSGLKELSRSPAHYKSYLDRGIEETPAMRAGKIVHLLALEPEIAKTRIVVCDVLRITEKLRADNPGKLVCRLDEFLKYKLAIDNFKNHKAVKYILDGAKFEVSFFWEMSGIPCKARFDIYNPDKNIFVDVKWSGVDIISQRKIKGDGFDRASELERHIYDQKLHWQNAFYTEAALHLTGKDPKFNGWIFIESHPPHLIMPYSPDFGFLEVARQEYGPLLELYSSCVSVDSWKGPEEKFYTASPPHYAFED